MNILEEIRRAKRIEALRGEWEAEVELMHRGNNADWLSWTPACRSLWAKQMIELADAEGFFSRVPAELRTWILDLKDHGGSQ